MLGAHAVSEAPISALPQTLVAYTVTASAGSYVITGATAGLLTGRRVTAAGGSYAITGSDATLTYVEVPRYGGGYGHVLDLRPRPEAENDDDEVMLAVIKEFLRLAA